MVAIITGDIINSRKELANLWMPELKEVLNKTGAEPEYWEIYRGDSFQIQLKPQSALAKVLTIKATIKQFKELDVRMAVGIGAVSYQTKRITESNGEAFLKSGECFEALKKQTLAINTPWVEFDSIINLLLNTLGVTINSWTPNSAKIIKEILDNPESTQKELALLLNKNQSNISSGLKRAGYEAIQEILKYYTKQIKLRC